MPKLTLGAEVHRFVPKLFCAEVTRAEHRLPPRIQQLISGTQISSALFKLSLSKLILNSQYEEGARDVNN